MPKSTPAPADTPAADDTALSKPRDRADLAEAALDAIANYHWGSDAPRGPAHDVIDTLKRIAGEALAALRANRA